MQLESYKKKIEEIPDLRNQIKTLESQIDNYVMEKVRFLRLVEPLPFSISTFCCLSIRLLG